MTEKRAYIPSKDGVINLDSSQVKSASYILNKLFSNYPLHVGFFPNNSNREEKSRLFLEYALRYSVRYGVARAISPKLEGIAMWLPPSKKDFDYWKAFRCGTLFGWARLSSDFLTHILPIANHLASIRARTAKQPHWYLFNIGVATEHQGQHHSSRLLNSMLKTIDATNKSCYLETHTEKNVEIFAKFGFNVVDKSSIPKTSITNWAMLRNPR